MFRRRGQEENDVFWAFFQRLQQRRSTASFVSINLVDDEINVEAPHIAKSAVA